MLLHAIAIEDAIWKDSVGLLLKREDLDMDCKNNEGMSALRRLRSALKMWRSEL